jgi:citronellyl-CoA dehydrogenase
MVGKAAEQAGAIKHGSKMIQAVANARVPKFTIVLGGSFGAGNYGMCGRGFDPRFIFAWPSARTAVMGGAQAAQVMDIVNRNKLQKMGLPANDEALAAMSDGLRRRLDAESAVLFGTARLWDDGIIDPRDTRRILGLCLDMCRRSRRQRTPAPQHLRHRPFLKDHGDPMKFTPEHRQLDDTVVKFCREGTQPLRPRMGEGREFPSHEVFKKLGDLGLLGLKYPEEYGGAGLDFSYSDGDGRGAGPCNCGGVPMAIGVQTDMATPALARFGSDELRASSWRPPSPATGGLPGRQRTRRRLRRGGGEDHGAKSEGGDYVINGTKMWITNGLKADWCCLLANTSDGPPHKNKSLIVVPMDAPGITQAEDPQDRHAQLRHRAAVLRQRARAQAQPHRPGRPGLHLPDAAVPGRAAVGRGRFAAQPGPLIDQTIDYTRQRKAFGKSILDNQVVHYRLAELRTEVEALRALTYRAVEMYVSGKDVTKLASMAKLKCGRLSARGGRQLPAVLGRHGLHGRQPDLAGLPRQPPGVSIGGGADEVMLGIICKLEGTLPGKA